MKRYNESAKVEADILAKIEAKGGSKNGVVHLKEYFVHTDKEGDHMCLVFETLGKSLFDFIKENKYKGRKLESSAPLQILSTLAFTSLSNLCYL